MRWRGNQGDSVPFLGSHVPMRPAQRMGDWFDGRKNLLTYGRYDAMNQNKVEYQSQQTSVHPSRTTALSERTASLPGLHGTMQQYAPFQTVQENVAEKVVQMDPASRAGAPRRRARRRSLRRSRRQSRLRAVAHTSVRRARGRRVRRGGRRR